MPKKKPPEGRVLVAEVDLLKASGYTKKGLRNMRYGLANSQGSKVEHSLIEGVHWIYSPIVYTEAGVAEVMRKAEKRDKKA